MQKTLNDAACNATFGQAEDGGGGGGGGGGERRPARLRKPTLEEWQAMQKAQMVVVDGRRCRKGDEYVTKFQLFPQSLLALSSFIFLRPATLLSCLSCAVCFRL